MNKVEHIYINKHTLQVIYNTHTC